MYVDGCDVAAANGARDHVAATAKSAVVLAHSSSPIPSATGDGYPTPAGCGHEYGHSREEGGDLQALRQWAILGSNQ